MMSGGWEAYQKFQAMNIRELQEKYALRSWIYIVHMVGRFIMMWLEILN